MCVCLCVFDVISSLVEFSCGGDVNLLLEGDIWIVFWSFWRERSDKTMKNSASDQSFYIESEGEDEEHSYDRDGDGSDSDHSNDSNEDYNQPQESKTGSLNPTWPQSYR